MIEKHNFQKHKFKVNVSFTCGNKFLMGKMFLFDIIPWTVIKLL